MLTNIDIEIKGNYYWEPAEQDYHEAFIDYFNSEFSNWLDTCGVMTSGVIAFNIYYLPTSRKFYVFKISKKESEILERLRKDSKFYSKYFTDSLKK